MGALVLTSLKSQGKPILVVALVSSMMSIHGQDGNEKNVNKMFMLM